MFILQMFWKNNQIFSFLIFWTARYKVFMSVSRKVCCLDIELCQTVTFSLEKKNWKYIFWMAGLPWNKDTIRRKIMRFEGIDPHEPWNRLHWNTVNAVFRKIAQSYFFMCCWTRLVQKQESAQLSICKIPYWKLIIYFSKSFKVCYNNLKTFKKMLEILN